MAGLTDIEIGNYTKVFVKEIGGSAWTEIENVQSFTHPTDERNIVEVAQFGQLYPRKIAGSASVGNAEVMVNYLNSKHKAIDGFYAQGKKLRVGVQVSSSDRTKADAAMHYQFNGQIASRTVAGEFDSVVTTTYSISVDGQLNEWEEGIIEGNKAP